MKKNIIRIILILIGSFISAAGLNLFIVPEKLLSGGLTGIAMIINHYTNINVGYFVFILNIPLFIMAYKKVDRKFTAYSFIAVASESIFLVLTKDLAHFCPTNDILLNCIIGGVVGGLGGGIVLRQRACQGGTDILSVIYNDKVPFDVAMLGFLLSGTVVFIGMFIIGVPKGLYTLISMYAGTLVCSKTLDGLDVKKMLFIVTDNDKDVAEFINKEIGRGCTILYGEGSFTNSFKVTLWCIVSATETADLIQGIKDIDKNSFISVSDISAVYGRGFKKPVF